MNSAQKAKMIFVGFAVVVGLIFAVKAIQFGNKLSDQCEQRYADAARILQGK
jgi:hypothetical protein